MLYILCSIYDHIADSYSAPSLEINEDTFKRHVSDLIINKQEPFYSHAEDFDLYVIGEFNSDTGVISDCDHPEFLMRLEDIKNAVSDNN